MRYSEQFREHIEYAFAAFCRIVLRNAAISAYRDFGRKQKHEVSLDYLMSETPFEPFTTDNYFEQYDKPTAFVVKGQKIIIASERLADILAKLPVTLIQKSGTSTGVPEAQLITGNTRR